jgi:hypothetical protein
MAKEDIEKHLGLWYNTAALYARRKSRPLEQFLHEAKDRLIEMIYTYKRTYSAVYKVDDSLLDWWTSLEGAEADEKAWQMFHMSCVDRYYKQNETYLLEYKGNLYGCERVGKTTCIRSISGYDTDGKEMLSYQYTCETDYSPEHPSGPETVSTLCGNDSCPFHKNSPEEPCHGTAKHVHCTAEDMRTCGQCKTSGIALPQHIDLLFEAAAYCMLHRDTPERKPPEEDRPAGTERQEGNPVPFPRPESDAEIHVWFGADKEVSFSVPGRHHTGTGGSGTHASPREHERKGYTRRGYTRKNGTYVRPAEVRATTVNKGHTKTLYRLAMRKAAENRESGE